MIDTNFPSDLYTLLPYQLHTYVDPTYITGDIVHKYWQEQLQINHGANDYFITWSDNPGLVMSHFDATNLPEGLLAQQYTFAMLSIIPRLAALFSTTNSSSQLRLPFILTPARSFPQPLPTSISPASCS